MKRSYANLMLIGVTIVWGGGFIATSGALDTFSPFYIMMIRFVGAAIIPFCLCFKKLIKLDSYVITRGLMCGVLLFLAFAFQTFGLKYSSPSKNAFLTATNVVFVPYLLWIYVKRKPHRKEIIASVLCLIGIALLTLKPNALMLSLGDVLSIVCAFFFATHMIALERYSRHSDALVMTTLQMIGAGVLSAICAFIFEQPPTSFQMRAIGNLAYLVFVSTLLAYLVQTYAQRFTSANSASLILSMEALFASIFSFVIYQETLSAMMIIGVCFIFMSVFYIEYKPKEK